MSLHPEYKTMLERFYALNLPDYSELSATEARELTEKILGARTIPEISLEEKQNRIIKTTTHDIPIRIYYPSKTEKLPAIIYFHGGGFVIGNVDQWDYPCARLAKISGMVVISVDYRLAPEHVFPSALDDAYSALCWVHEYSDDLKIDTNRIIVGGDSAGGNLAAAISLLARDRNGPAIAMQWLLYPWLDDDFTTQSYLNYGEGYLLSIETSRWFCDLYWPKRKERSSQYSFPLKSENLSGLPPSYIVTAECDPLRDEGERYAKELQLAGNKVTNECIAGMIHGFFIHFMIQAANDAVLAVIDKLKQLNQ